MKKKMTSNTHMDIGTHLGRAVSIIGIGASAYLGMETCLNLAQRHGLDSPDSYQVPALLFGTGCVVAYAVGTVIEDVVQCLAADYRRRKIQ